MDGMANIGMAWCLFFLACIQREDHRRWSSVCRVVAVINLVWGIWLLVSQLI